MVGNPKTGPEEEKTIMLVGATGSGKSTLVDGIVNYVMGVSFDDPFRFTLVQLEEEEKKIHNQVIIYTVKMTVNFVYYNIDYIIIWVGAIPIYQCHVLFILWF